MKLKSVLLYLLLLSSGLNLTAQRLLAPQNLPTYDQRRWHFGFTIGPDFQMSHISNSNYNIMGMDGLEIPKAAYDGFIEGIYYFSEIPHVSTGFHVGIITSLRLGKHFNVRAIPSLTLGQKNFVSRLHVLEFKPDGKYIVYAHDTPTTKTQVKSTYIGCPILFKYKAVRIRDVKPYVVAGPNIRYDLATTFENPITLKKLDTSVEFGMGSDFYMASFRLGVEVRFGIGFMNLLETDRPADDPNPYITPTIEKITSKRFTVAINFE